VRDQVSVFAGIDCSGLMYEANGILGLLPSSPRSPVEAWVAPVRCTPHRMSISAETLSSSAIDLALNVAIRRSNRVVATPSRPRPSASSILARPSVEVERSGDEVRPFSARGSQAVDVVALPQELRSASWARGSSRYALRVGLDRGVTSRAALALGP